MAKLVPNNPAQNPFAPITAIEAVVAEMPGDGSTCDWCGSVSISQCRYRYTSLRSTGPVALDDRLCSKPHFDISIDLERRFRRAISVETSLVGKSHYRATVATATTNSLARLPFLHHVPRNFDRKR